MRQSILALQEDLVNQVIELGGPLDGSTLDGVGQIGNRHVIFGYLLDFQYPCEWMVVHKPQH